MSDAYQGASYGEYTIGFGERPAVIVVDFQTAFTDPKYPIGGFKHIHDAATRRPSCSMWPGAAASRSQAASPGTGPIRICLTGRSARFANSSFSITTVWRWTRKFGTKSMITFSPNLHRRSSSTRPLTTFLTKHNVDTVIVTGCTTSGCVRASTIDSFSHGFRTIIPESCVGDADEGPHNDNLRDVGRRYADVMDRGAVEAYFDDVRKKNA